MSFKIYLQVCLLALNQRSFCPSFRICDSGLFSKSSILFSLPLQHFQSLLHFVSGLYTSYLYIVSGSKFATDLRVVLSLFVVNFFVYDIFIISESGSAKQWVFCVCLNFSRHGVIQSFNTILCGCKLRSPKIMIDKKHTGPRWSVILQWPKKCYKFKGSLIGDLEKIPESSIRNDEQHLIKT